MSVYTTEVRYICESLSGLTESTGINGIDNCIKLSIPKIFEDFPIFDENYREILNQAFINYYMFREIAFVNPQIFKIKLNQRFDLIMRNKYNDLYKAKMTDFNPLFNVDMTETYEHTIENTNNATLTGNNKTNSKSNITSNTTDNITSENTLKNTSNTTNNTSNSNTTTNTNNNTVTSTSTDNSSSDNTLSNNKTNNTNNLQLNSSFPSEELTENDISDNLFLDSAIKQKIIHQKIQVIRVKT